MMLTKVNLFDKLSNVNVKMQKLKLCEGLPSLLLCEF